MNLGRIALKRGPLVYCLEQVDNPGGSVQCLRIAAAGTIREVLRPDLFDGVVTLAADGHRLGASDWESHLYRTEPPQEEATELTAVPYYLWSNRAPGSMLVWIPQA